MPDPAPTGDLREQLARALACPICGVSPGTPCLRAGADNKTPHMARVQAATALVPVVEAETAALRGGVCPGCMEREDHRDQMAEASRQNGVKYEQAKAAWYRERKRAEEAERAARVHRDERDEAHERAEEAERQRDEARDAAERVRTLCARGTGTANEYQIWTVDVLTALDQPKETPR